MFCTLNDLFLPNLKTRIAISIIDRILKGNFNCRDPFRPFIQYILCDSQFVPWVKDRAVLGEKLANVVGYLFIYRAMQYWRGPCGTVWCSDPWNRSSVVNVRLPEVCRNGLVGLSLPSCHKFWHECRTTSCGSSKSQSVIEKALLAKHKRTVQCTWLGITSDDEVNGEVFKSPISSFFKFEAKSTVLKYSFKFVWNLEES